MKNSIIYASFFSFIPFSQSSAQCINTEFRVADNSNSDNSIGNTFWSGTENTSCSDNNYTVATFLLLGGTSHYLTLTDFDFYLPAASTICGIEVVVERQRESLIGSSVFDNSVRIIKNGSVTGSDYAIGGSWPTSDGFATYGGPTDLWGETWNASDINNENFGFAISTGISGLVLPSARIDSVALKVYYEEPVILPTELFSFSGQCENNAIYLQCQTSSESNGDYFTIEKSNDGSNWQILNEIKGVGNSYTMLSYNFVDSYPNSEISYYRLKKTDINGSSSYSEIITIDNCNSTHFNLEVNVYPQPAGDVLNLNISGLFLDKVEIYLFNSQGKRILHDHLFSESTLQTTYKTLDVTQIKEGIYYLQLIVNNEWITKKVVINHNE